MSAIETLLRQPAAQAVGWALLQFVWQGTAVGVLTALALLALRRSASDVRYVVSAIGLALMLTLPVVSGVQKLQALRVEASAAAVVPAAPGLRTLAQSPEFDRSAGARPGAAGRETAGPGSASAASRVIASMRIERLLPTLILIWIAGVSMLSLRLLTGWIWVQRLRARGNAPAGEAWQQMATRLSRRLHISRAITLLESTLVDVPTVIGWLKPVVLLPASAVAALSPQQLEAILAHELAHIRRHDYLVNLLQTLVETLLFYHPAVWWLSRRIRIERENCCDDLAVSLCGDPVAYASALADLESLRSETAPTHHIAMAATGGSLLHRIRRLLGAPSSHSGRGPAWLAGSVALLLIGGIALGADGLGRQQASTRPATAPSKAVLAQTVTSADATTPVVSPPRAQAIDAQRAQDLAVVAAVRARDPGSADDRAALAAAEADIARIANASAEPAVAAAGAPVASAVPAVAAVESTLAVVAAMATAPGTNQSVSMSRHSDDQSGTWSWSNNGEKLQVSYSGTFEFTEDDTDVRQLSAGGSLKISDGAWLFGRHSVEIRERGGQMDRRYYVNASERPYEPEGRVWLRENLPKFVRNTGIGATARVARFLKSGGVASVMGEISRIDSAYVKGIYYKELFKQATLTPEQYRQAMIQASREMKSDYELASLLIAIADHLPNDEVSRDAYFTAAASISSDYEVRRVYSTMLKRGPVSAQTLSGILTHSATIDSDDELSELLRQIMAQQTLDDRNRAAFFRSVSTLNSDYERHRVLKTVVERSPDAATMESALSQAASLSSDYEAGTFLHEVLAQSGVEGTIRAPFFKVVGRMSSGYEKGRLLQSVAKKPGVSDDTLREVLRSSRGMSGHELSQLLMTVAAAHALNGDLRDAYLDAADRLSGYDQSQVLAALVKSERRR
jgi:beta-lactamase regulating signal transducer with metallopeptidase domain